MMIRVVRKLKQFCASFESLREQLAFRTTLMANTVQLYNNRWRTSFNSFNINNWIATYCNANEKLLRKPINNIVLFGSCTKWWCGHNGNGIVLHFANRHRKTWEFSTMRYMMMVNALFRCRCCCWWCFFVFWKLNCNT